MLIWEKENDILPFKTEYVYLSIESEYNINIRVKVFFANTIKQKAEENPDWFANY